jgi:hypothetical protein
MYGSEVWVLKRNVFLGSSALIHEGPFEVCMSNLADYSSHIVLHAKYPPKFAPHLCVLTLRFYRDNLLFYSYKLGKCPIRYEEYCKRGIVCKWDEKEILDIINKIEAAKSRNNFFLTGKISIRLEEPEPKEEDELEILKSLNEKRRKSLAENIPNLLKEAA